MRFVSYMTPGFPTSLFELVAREMGAELHLETETSGPPPGNDPFRDGSFDAGWICSTSFVDLALRSDNPSIALAGVAWVPDDPDSHGRPVYFGDLVVRRESDVVDLETLRGRRIGCNDPVSLSGHLALRLAIERLGADPDTFAELQFTGGHHRSLDGVVAGDLDAAVVDSVVRVGRSRHDEAVANLRVVRRLGPWPVQPLVVRSDLPEATRVEIQRTLLDAARRPELGAELRAAALTDLVAVDADHYAPVFEAMNPRFGQ